MTVEMLGEGGGEGGRERESVAAREPPDRRLVLK